MTAALWAPHGLAKEKRCCLQKSGRRGGGPDGSPKITHICSRTAMHLLGKSGLAWGGPYGSEKNVPETSLRATFGSVSWPPKFCRKFGLAIAPVRTWIWRGSARGLVWGPLALHRFLAGVGIASPRLASLAFRGNYDRIWRGSAEGVGPAPPGSGGGARGGGNGIPSPCKFGLQWKF